MHAQDPGLLRRGSNNIQLYAGHRIWLVSAVYAKTLESVVPSGSLTGGAVAKAKRFAAHLEDSLHSVTESPQHFAELPTSSRASVSSCALFEGDAGAVNDGSVPVPATLDPRSAWPARILAPLLRAWCTSTTARW
jgi:hypothetical protein